MVVGIDYSMTSPAICKCTDIFSYENCRFLFITTKKKWACRINDQILGIPLFEYKDNIERFKKLALITRDFISDDCRDYQSYDANIGIEGYAMGAKGQVFNIGENTGILKYHLAENNWPIDVYSPSMIKKFATGKGNAKKEDMYASFVDETGVDLGVLFEQSTSPKVNSPVSDIVDAYYIAKLHHSLVYK